MADRLTIDELARRTGMTVRNLRAHQSRGLLPPPEVEGRTGYYAAEHIARVELIRELQAEGFNLEAIRKLLASAGGKGDEVLRFTRALREPFEDEAPEIVTAAELAEQTGSSSPDLLVEAERLGLLRSLGADRYEQRSPRLARAGAELRALGVSAEDALELAKAIRRHADAIADRFARMFIETVWEPFDAAGRPEERWPEVREALERVRPLAADAVLSVFQLAMSDEAEKMFDRELERGAKPRRKR
ncbi:MAG: MerR family transcriptional regulator [Solirubrobacterales bacterium]|nr:MerR family transcriptional regulator [Solirubrobacterales bacterium]